jgi:hypothetical protein
MKRTTSKNALLPILLLMKPASIVHRSVTPDLLSYFQLSRSAPFHATPHLLLFFFVILVSLSLRALSPVLSRFAKRDLFYDGSFVRAFLKSLSLLRMISIEVSWILRAVIYHGHVLRLSTSSIVAWSLRHGLEFGRGDEAHAV